MPITIAKQTTASDSIGVKPKIKKKVQILRGVASVAVLWNHVGAVGYLDPSFKLTGFFVPYGSMRPLLFFMLSGYLIGTSVKNPLVDWPSIKKFLGKRLMRLYPVYLLAVLATFVITNDRDTAASLLTHLVFLQGASGRLVSENVPLWSMPFEFFFYLAFIPISFFRVKPVFAAAASVLIGFTLLLAQVDAPFAISYCFGMVFWCTGLIVARAKWEDAKYPTSHLLALLLLLLCYQHLEVGQYIFNRLAFPSLPARANLVNHPVRLVSLEFLPLCILILAAFNNKRMPWSRTLFWLVLLPPLGRAFYLIYGRRFDQSHAMGWSIAFFLLSIAFLLFPFRVRLRPLEKGFAFLGSISYATYLIHYPIMFLFLRFEPFSGSAATAFVRLGLYLTTTFTAAYVLEKFHKKLVGNSVPKYIGAGELEYTAS